MLYSAAKKILFCLEPETAHHFSLKSLKLAARMGLTRFLLGATPQAPRSIMGLSFPNAIGLSAGFDRNGDYIDALASLGFGFIEIGTIVPAPQVGNPRPRIFRLTKNEAIINRMGFASRGLDYVVERLEQTNYSGILGINLGKNKETPNHKAIDDYLKGFNTFAKYASYITINLSSPNTKGLRELLKPDYFTDLLTSLKSAQKTLLKMKKKYVPLVIKISPDLSPSALIEVANTLLACEVDAVIASNTTLSREGIAANASVEIGGLSGRPLFAKNITIIKTLNDVFQQRIPIIASGGIMDERAATLAMKAGASLLQIYTGFIYQGPGLIRRLVNSVAAIKS